MASDFLQSSAHNQNITRSACDNSYPVCIRRLELLQHRRQGPSKTIEKPVETVSDSPSTDVAISLLKITNGRITVLRGGAHAKPRIYDKVEIEARTLSYARSCHLPWVPACLPGAASN